MLRRTLRIGLLISIFTIASVTAAPLTSEAIYKQSVPSIMVLHVTDKSGKEFLGSAFLAVKGGMAVTAWHVVNGASTVTAKFSNGEEFDVAGLIDKDESRDIALIKVKEYGKPLLILSPNAPAIGSKAFVIGSPKGFEFSISDGIVSQIQAMGASRNYQFSCPASPGNSGGPLINASGHVIGVVSWQYTDGQNLNFAVPSNYVLGLDPTLPTQPWNTVKSTTPPNAPTVTSDQNEALDKLLAECDLKFGDIFTGDIYIDQMLDLPHGYDHGIPSFVYTILIDLSKKKDALTALTTTDPVRTRFRQTMLDTIDAFSSMLQHRCDAIRAAQKAHGWTAESNDDFSQALGALQTIKNVSPDDYKVMMQSDTFRLVRVENTREIYNTYRVLGSYGWIEIGDRTIPESLHLIVVKHHSFGENLGFQSDDTIIGVGAKPNLTSIVEFIDEIKDNLGSQVDATILRNGEKQILHLDIPKELPAGD